MKKNLIALILSLAMMLTLSVGASAANTVIGNPDVTITVDGKTVDIPANQKWVSEDGYTMVGARALVEGVGGSIKWDSATRSAVITGLTKEVGMYSPRSDREWMVGAAAWQLSAECNALIMQAFNTGKRTVDEMLAKAAAGQDGFTKVDGKLYKDGVRVAVFSDIDATLVDGVHYTSDYVGLGGDWCNAAMLRFVQSDGCTALPGAVDFVNYCVDNGIEFFYMTNRYDQGYKVGESDSKGGYNGETGYVKADGTVVGSSCYEVYGKTYYDISYESMTKLGYPINENAHLILNDSKLNGSNKQPMRDAVAAGGTIKTGERVHESNAFPETFDTTAHYIAMFCGDDLNDIDYCFSAPGVDAVSRVQTAIDNMEKWGTKWIVLPNAIYGSSITYAKNYGMTELFTYFDYLNPQANWDMFK